ncbi:gamma-glutamyltransferase family protein [Alteribacillus sp. JSM 102045]|uniref:gamma-glutamyltransferase family protein n=1 Tax=Alteribacillus sp. JSM 102045 TaxID=1562101 RepID=UPI0035C1EC14
MLKIMMSLSLLLNLLSSGGAMQPGEEDNDSEVASENSEENYGVTASHPLAVEAGMEVLENGGNAADAAVAVSYALNVVEPFGSGIGGGGQALLLPPDEEEPIVYDYKVSAPSKEDWNGDVTGVPGFVKGMDTIHKEHGSESFDELISPAIELAEDGFEVDPVLAERLDGAKSRLSVDKLSHLYPDGEPIESGEILKQSDLAETLKKIQAEGPSAFYEGEIGENFAEKVSNVKESDLEDYEVTEPAPVKGELDEGMIYSASPPLSGVPFVQSLKLAEYMNIEETKDNVSEFAHVMSEISRVTNNDKINKVGDPSSNDDMDQEELVSDEHIEDLAEKISAFEPSDETASDDETADDDHTDTTHFVVVDKDGMMVSATNTLSNFFGSGDYVDGYFINNADKYFSKLSNSPNSYKPGKRSRSSTAPSIFMNEDRTIGIGTPGGGRIPSVMAQVLSRHFYFDESLEEAVEALRFYGRDGTFYAEPGFSEEVLDDMKERGYGIRVNHHTMFFGGIQALEVNQEDGTINGIADERRGGSWDSSNKEEE